MKLINFCGLSLFLYLFDTFLVGKENGKKHNYFLLMSLKAALTATNEERQATEDMNRSNKDRFEEVNFEGFDLGQVIDDNKETYFMLLRQGFGDNCDADDLKVFTHQ